MVEKASESAAGTGGNGGPVRLPETEFPVCLFKGFRTATFLTICMMSPRVRILQLCQPPVKLGRPLTS
jgi:hypothetical protein